MNHAVTATRGEPGSAFIIRPRLNGGFALSTRRIGDYELIERIGHGATGRVWRAVHSTTGNVVAVKELRSEFADDDVARSRFLQEGRLLQANRLPGAVLVLDVIDDEDAAAIVMDLIEGVTLRQVVIDESPLDVRRAVRMTMTLSGSLAAAHNAGLVHGDVKPENVLVVDQGMATESTVLTDFGLARVVRGSASANTRSQIMGTPHYAAPEIHRGQERGRPADVYALGVILYELVAGRRPFEAQSVEAVMRAHLDEPPTRTGDFSSALWATTVACLDKNPEARPDSSQLSQQLKHILDDDLTTPELLPTEQWHKSRNWSAAASAPDGRRPAFVRIAAASVLALAAGSIGFAVLRDRPATVEANMVPQAGTFSSSSAPQPSTSTPSQAAVTMTGSTPVPPAPQDGLGEGSGSGVDSPSPLQWDSPGQGPSSKPRPPATPPRNSASGGGNAPVGAASQKPTTPQTAPAAPNPAPLAPSNPNRPTTAPRPNTPTSSAVPLGEIDAWRRTTLPDGRSLEVNLRWNRTATHNDWTKVSYRVSGGEKRYAINLALYEAGTRVFFVGMNAEPGGAWRTVSLRGHATRRAVTETFQVQVYAANRQPQTRLGVVKFSY